MARRANGEGGLYKDQRGYWVGQYRVDGKRKTISGKTQTEVRMRLREIQAALDNPDENIPVESTLTLGQWADSWLEIYAKPSIKITTYESYESYIRNQIKPFIGDIRLPALSAEQLQRFFNQMAETGKFGNEKGLSVKTLYNLKNLVHALLAQAVSNRLIQYNVIESVKLPRNYHQEMRVLSREEQEKLLAAADESPNRAALGIKFALFTGIRVGEMLGLKWDNVNLENGTFRIKEILRRVTNNSGIGSNSTVVKSLQTTKTESSNRTVYLIPELIDDLKAYREWQQSAADENPVFNPQNFVFITAGGSYIEPRTYQDLFQRVVRASGIARVNFHALRHTFATRAIEQGMDILVLAKILGHAQASTTLNMYGHALPDHKRESMEKLRCLYVNGAKTVAELSEIPTDSLQPAEKNALILEMA